MPASRFRIVLTHARDGTVRVWNAQNHMHLKTLKVSDSWVTNTCHFEQSNRVGVASIDRSISFYDGASCELTGQLTGLDTAPMCIGCWNDQLQERMIVGDDCGNIALYDTTRNGANEASMSAASYRRGEDKGRHSDWVTKVEYFSDLNLMISSSLDGTMKIGELEGLLTKRGNRISTGGPTRESRTTRVLGEGTFTLFLEPKAAASGRFCFRVEVPEHSIA